MLNIMHLLLKGKKVGKIKNKQSSVLLNFKHFLEQIYELFDIRWQWFYWLSSCR